MPTFVKGHVRKGRAVKGYTRKQKSYMVQAILGRNFEDIYVKATSPSQALKRAKSKVKSTRLDHRFTRFVF